MKVLFLCYDLGKYSTGITNKRILKGLLDKGIDCRVISGNHSDVIDSSQLYVCSSFPNRPSRFFYKLGNIVGRDLDYYFWEIRAKRKAIEICKNWTPDIIYARANPPAVFQVGLFISKRNQKPLFLHSGDPIPPTPDWNDNIYYRKKKVKAVYFPLLYASEISFVNMEMINYQQSLLDFNIINRAFVSPNPIEFSFFKELNKDFRKSDKFIFVYLGSFTGSRSPEKLIKAFDFFVRQICQSAELHIYGSDVSLTSLDVNCYIENSIRIFPKVSDVRSALLTADVLLDVDSPYKPQVFTSNKLMDYLPVKCPIICVTPSGSATRKLLESIYESVYFCENDYQELINCFELAYSRRNESVNYNERESIVKSLSIENVTFELITRFDKYVD